MFLKKTSFFLIGYLFLVVGTPAVGDMPLVVAEIQKSIEKEHQVKFPKQSPKPLDEGLKKQELDGPAKKKKKVKPPPEVVKKKSPGELKIEAQLARNRAILKKRQKDYFDSLKKGKKAAPVRGDWLDQKKQALDQWESNKSNALKRWQENKKATLKRWREERSRFKKLLPEIKKDLTEIPFGKAVPKGTKISTKRPTNLPRFKAVSTVATTTSEALELSFIEEAFRIPIRSQGLRPTCAAFAAVRAMEILGRADGKKDDLSEQFFYYASKPDCQQSPCRTPGSWPRLAYEESRDSGRFTIPTEKNCPYQENDKPGNETQIPLASGCRQGSARVESFSLVKNRHEIQMRLRAGQPVIGGFKLSDDFFLNTGYVFKEPGQRVGKDLHSQGHAILLVGVMELPESLHASQGRFCTLIANSWGEGWGRGGHACLSDKWFDEFRYQISFIALEKVAFK